MVTLAANFSAQAFIVIAGFVNPNPNPIANGRKRRGCKACDS